MESKQNNYLQDIITNSLLLTSILIIYGLLIYVIDISLYVKWWYGISVLVISVALLIYFGINYRNSIGGILSYKDSFIYLYIPFPHTVIVLLYISGSFTFLHFLRR